MPLARQVRDCVTFTPCLNTLDPGDAKGCGDLVQECRVMVMQWTPISANGIIVA